MLKYEGECIEIKEQMYQDKLANLKEQLKQLVSNVHPEYLRRVKKIEQAFNDRIILNDAFLEFEVRHENSSSAGSHVLYFPDKTGGPGVRHREARFGN